MGRNPAALGRKYYSTNIHRPHVAVYYTIHNKQLYGTTLQAVTWICVGGGDAEANMQRRVAEQTAWELREDQLPPGVKAYDDGTQS